MTEEVSVEKCTKVDAFFAGELARELWGDRAFPGSFYRQAVDSFGESVFVAKTSNGKVVGYGLGLKEPYSEDAWILSVAVHPDFRGMGVGSKFLSRLIGFFQDQGIKRLHATVDPENAPSLAMCEKTGFREVSREDDYFGPGLPQIRMCLDL